MKRIYLFVAAVMVACLAAAQPSWVKKASKSVFTLKTFSAGGDMIGSANGFFIGENGEAVSAFTPFVGAERAVAFDSKGKEMAVDCILGANEMYDVVKFRLAVKKSESLPMAASKAAEGSVVQLLPYAANKAAKTVAGTVGKVETFGDAYGYYTVALKLPANVVGCPLLNSEGEVLAMVQEPSAGAEDSCFAVSAAFARAQKLTGLSINDPVLKKTNIKKGLPDDYDQAVLTMYLAGSTQDSLVYAQMVDDFIGKFPGAADGYVYRAQLLADANRFADAAADMDRAVEVGDKKDDALYNYARLIYQKEQYKKDIPFEPWTLDKAVEKVDEAYGINPVPAYMLLKAQIRYTQKDYAAAYDVFDKLANGGQRTPDVFFGAARCKALLGDSVAMLALLDSAVATFSKPYLKEAAPYLLARATAKAEMGKYRNAVMDFNDYEKLMATSVNDNFYYLKAQTELEGHLYQQALADFTKAIELSPNNTLYYAERASLEVRVGLYDEAVASSEKIISIEATNSDGYLFKGLALCLKGNKAEGRQSLLKAKELGDARADELIEKYSK